MLKPNTRGKVISEGLIELSGYICNVVPEDEFAFASAVYLDGFDEVLHDFLLNQTVHGGFSAHPTRLAEEISRSLRAAASKRV